MIFSSEYKGCFKYDLRNYEWCFNYEYEWCLNYEYEWYFYYEC